MKTKIERLKKIICSGVKGVANQEIPIGKIEFMVLQEDWEVGEDKAENYQNIDSEMTVKELLDKKAGEGYRPASFNEVGQELFLGFDNKNYSLSYDCTKHIGYLDQFIKDEKGNLFFATIYDAAYKEADTHHFFPLISRLEELSQKSDYPALPFIKGK